MTFSVFGVACKSLVELSYDSKISVYDPVVTLAFSIVTVAKDALFEMVTKEIEALPCLRYSPFIFAAALVGVLVMLITNDSSEPGFVVG